MFTSFLGLFSQTLPFPCTSRAAPQGSHSLVLAPINWHKGHGLPSAAQFPSLRGQPGLPVLPPLSTHPSALG